MEATATEVLFGGAAGGGKSFGQLVDAFLYALQYPHSRQLILRRTFPELEKSLIRVSRELYPKEVYSYHSTNHVGVFQNGSILDFGYCAGENDVFQYQSAEYDVIRFDELTHFTEFQYRYLISRVRGANGYPKQIKSSTNPGGVGHAWVKARFVDPAPQGTLFWGEDGGSRIFIPSKIDDNRFLMEGDPKYKARLEALPEREKKALLLGDWNIFEGQYFTEFSYDIHTVDPVSLPSHWRRYRTIDYGLDRLACLWIAVDPNRRAYVYRELCESDLIVSRAAEKILAMTPPGETIYATLAPPDLWARSQESGRSKALLFHEHGLTLTRTANDRETGWLSVKELLRPGEESGPRLCIFRNCVELIKCLPLLQIDPLHPTDTMTEPHHITHAPDALRGFAIYYSHPAPGIVPTFRVDLPQDMREDYERADTSQREYIRRRWGLPQDG